MFARLLFKRFLPLTQAICLFLGAAYASAADGNAASEIVSQASPHWKKCQDAYSSVALSARLTDRNGTRSRFVDCLINQNVFLIDETLLGDGNRLVGRPESIVRAFNSRYSFLLSRADPAAGWVITQTRIPTRSEEWSYTELDINGEIVPYTTAHYQIWGVGLENLFSMDGVTVTDAIHTESDGEPAVVLSFECSLEAEKSPLSLLKRGRVTLLPDRFWCVTQLVVDLHGGGEESQIFDVGYVDGNEFPPVPSRVTRTITNAQGVELYEFDYLTYVPGAIDETKVTLTAFGLPEVVSGPQKKMPWLPTAIASTLAALAAWLAFWRLRRPSMGQGLKESL